MLNRNYFSHETPEGLDPTQRAQQIGIQTERCIGSICYLGVAENIGQMPANANVVGCGYVSSDQDVASCMMQGWISSSGHYQNLVNRNYAVIGVGVACNSTLCMLTQDFM